MSNYLKECKEKINVETVFKNRRTKLLLFMLIIPKCLKLLFYFNSS